MRKMRCVKVKWTLQDCTAFWRQRWSMGKKKQGIRTSIHVLTPIPYNTLCYPCYMLHKSKFYSNIFYFVWQTLVIKKRCGGYYKSKWLENCLLVIKISIDYIRKGWDSCFMKGDTAVFKKGWMMRYIPRGLWSNSPVIMKNTR